MKYDYSRQFAMIKDVPDLSPTFKNLRPVTTLIKKRGDKFGFIFVTVCGTMLFLNFFNINPKLNANDYSVGFRVLPDYMTGTSFTAYRKQRRNFILY